MRAGDVLVLWTDGLEERLTLAGVETLEVAALAASLLHRYPNGNDDACAIVARLEACDADAGLFPSNPN